MTLGSFLSILLLLFYLSLFLVFFFPFLSHLWLIWGTFGSPWSHMGVPEDILQP